MATAKESLNKIFEITTGDDRKYTPLWVLENKDIAFNSTSYNFPDLSGTFVDKKLPLGDKRVLNFYFQGEESQNEGNAFIESTKSSNKAWRVSHPFDGLLIVQPLSIAVSRTVNTFQVQATVQDTLELDDTKVIDVDTDTRMDTLSERQLEVATIEYSLLPVEPDSLGLAGQNVKTMGEEYNKMDLSIPAKADLDNLLKKATSSIDDLILKPAQAFQTISDLAKFPAKAQTAIEGRLLRLKDTFDSYANFLFPNSKETEKRYLADMGGVLLSSYATASITPKDTVIEEVTDERTAPFESLENAQLFTRERISDISIGLITFLRDYIDTFDNLQSQLVEEQVDKSYILDEENLRTLSDMVYLAMANLSEQLAGSAIERIDILQNDIVLIELVDKIYGGLGDNDENINTLIALNQDVLRYNDYLLIPKGTPIRFFI